AFAQPHHCGVRLGKCHARMNVYAVRAPGAISRRRDTEPTPLRCSASGPSCPSEEKSSQKSNGLAHHFARGHPRNRVTLPFPTSVTPRAKDPANGAVFATCVLVINSP